MDAFVVASFVEKLLFDDPLKERLPKSMALLPADIITLNLSMPVPETSDVRRAVAFVD